MLRSVLLVFASIAFLGILAVLVARLAGPNPRPRTSPRAELTPAFEPINSPASRVPAPTTDPRPAATTTRAAVASPTAARATASPDLFFERPWPLDEQIGWLTAQRCATPTPPVSNQNDNLPADGSPSCQGVIYGTTDGGATWARQYLGRVLVHTIAFVDRDHGWAVGTSHPQCLDLGCPTTLLRTTDGGASWTDAYDAAYTIDQPAFVSASDGWAVGVDCADRTPGENACAVRLLVSSDGGQNWSVAALGQSAAPMPMTVALSRPSQKDGWLALSGPQTSALLVTHDGAQSWQTLKSPIPGGSPATLNLDFVDSRHGWLLAGGQPSAGNQEKSLFSTSDGGATWKQLSAGAASTRSSISVSGKGMTGGYVVADGLQFLSPEIGWLTLGRFGLLHTVDGGANWTPSPIPNQADGFIAYRFANSRVVWALTPRSLSASTDGGASWRESGLP